MQRLTYNEKNRDELLQYSAINFTSRKNGSNFPIYDAIFAIFVTGVFSPQEKSSLLLRFLRYLRTFRGPSWLLCFLSLEFCYICYFCDICDICHGCFQLARKILVTLAIFAIFADISGSFLVSFFCKS